MLLKYFMSSEVVIIPGAVMVVIKRSLVGFTTTYAIGVYHH